MSESQTQYDTSVGDHNGYMDARQTGGGVSSGTMCIGARIDIDMGRPNNESIAGECNGLR